MDFHLEERRAWVRTQTHTVIWDRDPSYARFATGSSGRGGRIARLVRVWLRDSDGTDRAYLGSVCLCGEVFSGRDLRRVFRRVADHARRVGEPARTLRRRLKVVLQGVSQRQAWESAPGNGG